MSEMMESMLAPREGASKRHPRREWRWTQLAACSASLGCSGWVSRCSMIARRAFRSLGRRGRLSGAR